MIIGIAFLASCGPKERDAPPPSDSTTQNSDTIPKPDHKSMQFEPNNKTEPFTVDKAKKEIGDLISHSELQTWRRNMALGGEFKNIGEFFPRNEWDTDRGVMMWYTYDSVKTSSGFQKRLILACEPRHIRDIGKPIKAPILTTPDYIFTFRGSHSNFRLEDHTALDTRSIGHTMESAVANRQIEAYNERVRRRLHVNETTLFNQDDGAFFQNNVDSTGNPLGLLTRFVNQDGAVGMRYYFALDTTADRNKIRIFLIATDSEGKNMLYPTKERNADPLILQKSIPPVPGGGPLAQGD